MIVAVRSLPSLPSVVTFPDASLAMYPVMIATVVGSGCNMFRFFRSAAKDSGLTVVGGPCLYGL